MSTHSKSPKKSRFKFRPLFYQSHFITLGCLLGLLALWLGKIYTLDTQIHYLPLSLILLALTILLIKKQTKFLRFASLALIVIVCFAKASNVSHELKVYENLYNSKIQIFGTVQDDAAYNNYGDLEFNIAKLNFAGDNSYLPGKLRIRTKQNVAIYRGNRIFIEGTLKPILGAKTGSISHASIEVLQSELSSLEKFRLKFFASAYSSLPEPHASLGIGFLAGVRATIPKDFQDQLSKVGLTHIIAVSGYNLTILIVTIGRFGKKLSKYQKLLISLSLMAVFILITGFSPSIVRAAVVSFISAICAYYGRKISALNVILISALLTAAVNPVYLWQDLGWWLSFLAFFGVLILAPLLQQIIFKDKEPGLIFAICLESFSAQLVTAPLISHVFGTFSVVSLLANALVLPWIPAIMLLVFIVGLVGIYFPGLSLILGSLPKLLITPIIIIIEKLSSLGWAAIDLKLSQPAMLGCYLAILYFIALRSRAEYRSRIQPMVL